MKKKKGPGKWFPIVILLIMTAAAVATGIHAAGVASGKRSASKSKPSVAAANRNQDKTSGNGTGTAVQGDAISGVIHSVDGENKKVTVYQIAKMEEAEFSYSGATEVLTKFGSTATMLQLTPGMIVKTICKEGSDMLLSIREDEDAWVYKGILNLEVDRANYEMSIGEQKYQYDDQILVINQGKQVDLLDLSEKDVLTARGIEGKIYSLEVTVGHGTLEFSNYEDFVGGSIEVGYEVFDQIKEDMEYVLREGSYKLFMKHGKLEVNKYITITRGETVVVDLNEYRNEVGKSGQVTFVLNPKDAELYLDNELVETKDPVELSYGDYILEVRCEGYDSCSRLLSVSMPTQTIRIDLADSSTNTSDGSLSDLNPNTPGLDNNNTNNGSGNDYDYNPGASDDWEDNNSNSNSNDDDWESGDDIIQIDDVDTSEEIDDPDTSGSSGGNQSGGNNSGTGSGNQSGGNSSSGSTGTKIPGQYIIIQKPEGASVYFDGTYVGVAPVQIDKVTGEHQVTLRQDGYINKVYSVEVENDGEDTIYRFPNLTKE